MGSLSVLVQLPQNRRLLQFLFLGRYSSVSLQLGYVSRLP